VSLMTTGEVAAYLRLKERTVYDLVARQAIPCSRATGKLLFSRPLIDAWVEAHTDMPKGEAPASPRIYAGSSEPLLEWSLRQSGSGLAVLTGGSHRGLEAMARGEAVLAGIHLRDRETGDYTLPAIRATLLFGDVVAIRWARRSQGLIVAAGNPHGITGLADAIRRGLRLARRGPESGSDLLLADLLERENLPAALDGPVAETQGDLAGLVAMGEADCGLGIAAAAAGLGFLPLVWEEFDLVMRRRDYFEPPVQALLAFARTEDFARRAERLGGYDLTDHGKVRYNA
jgi:putative molybdopterin biosynthesis protein